MEQVLSQEEIDALLHGISEGEIETQKVEAPEEHKEAKSFDYIRYTRGKKERLPALDFIYDRFSKSFRSALSLFMEKEVEVDLQPIQYVGYEDFIKTLPLPTNMNIVVTENLKGFYIVIFDAKMIFSVLETIFGSTNISVPKIVGREFTKIEFNVIKKLIELVSAEMEKAWAPVYEIRCKYSRSEINPNYITMVAPEETVGITEFNIEIGDLTSWVKICMPYGILEPIKGYLMTTPSREDMEMREKWFGKLKASVLDVPIDVRAVLGKKKMPLEEFLNLSDGNVIVVDRYISDPVDIEIQQNVKFRGKMGTFKGNKAIRVEESVN
ncbi:MAG: Flagellar motor switch protein FliM [Syntrophorhabdus sp. PtaU1.Bin058]|nr:MAG: Flagellar motor switch protein FliM [Syntrophorhabdus sp. PtaU1.Bin058]